jgi:hypothetical protein
MYRVVHVSFCCSVFFFLKTLELSYVEWKTTEYVIELQFLFKEKYLVILDI